MPEIAVGTDVIVALRVGPGAVVVRCRLVSVTDTDDAYGFAYGTLPGHPERGEEAFHVVRGHDGEVIFEVVAFSRPADPLARLASPVTRLIQTRITRAYLGAGHHDEQQRRCRHPDRSGLRRHRSGRIPKGLPARAGILGDRRRFDLLCAALTNGTGSASNQLRSWRNNDPAELDLVSAARSSSPLTMGQGATVSPGPLASNYRTVDDARPRRVDPERDHVSMREKSSRADLAAALLAILVLATACSSAASRSAASTTAFSTTTGPTPGTAATTTRASGVLALNRIDWAQLSYPIDCQSALHPPVQVFQVVYAAPAPGVEVAVVMVACHAGAGTPPRVIYVYDGADSRTTPHRLQTLSDDGISRRTFDRLTASVAAAGSTVTATGSTYSSSSVPRCCPDGTFTSRWRWAGGSYQQIS